MRCEPFQNAISARVDGEELGLAVDDLEQHLVTCAGCRSYESAAIALHRRVRVRAAEPVPDLSEAILVASGQGVAPGRRPARTREWARYALLVVALTQLVVAIPALVLGEEAGTTIHLARELGSWDVALSVAWLLVALAPRRAAGMLPFTAALAVVMASTALLDVFDGRAPLFGEAHHVLDLVGLGLIWVLARSIPSDRSLLPFRIVRTAGT